MPQVTRVSVTNDSTSTVWHVFDRATLALSSLTSVTIENGATLDVRVQSASSALLLDGVSSLDNRGLFNVLASSAGVVSMARLRSLAGKFTIKWSFVALALESIDAAAGSSFNVPLQNTAQLRAIRGVGGARTLDWTIAFYTDEYAASRPLVLPTLDDVSGVSSFYIDQTNATLPAIDSLANVVITTARSGALQLPTLTSLVNSTLNVRSGSVECAQLGSISMLASNAITVSGGARMLLPRVTTLVGNGTLDASGGLISVPLLQRLPAGFRYFGSWQLAADACAVAAPLMLKNASNVALTVPKCS
jgi:hypothetical protein